MMPGSVVHVYLPEEWREGLRRLAKECEGTINQQVRLAIRERLAKNGCLPGNAERAEAEAGA